MPEILKDNNWTTVFISSCVGDAGFSKWNWLQGCDFIEKYEGYSKDPWYLKGENYRSVVKKKLDECFTINCDGNKLIILHIAEPHGPYDGVSGSSDNEVYYNACKNGDNSLQRIISLLNAYDISIFNSVFFITSDHGQQLNEYGNFGHGYTLNDEEILVPLVVFGKGIDVVGKSERVVSHIDIIPTIMNLCGIEYRSNINGENILKDNNTAGAKKRFIKTMNLINASKTYDTRVIEVKY